MAPLLGQRETLELSIQKEATGNRGAFLSVFLFCRLFFAILILSLDQRANILKGVLLSFMDCSCTNNMSRGSNHARNFTSFHRQTLFVLRVFRSLLSRYGVLVPLSVN